VDRGRVQLMDDDVRWLDANEDHPQYAEKEAGG
jgi:hypothetical protein